MGKIDNIDYTKRHRKEFRRVEKELLGKNTIRSIFHDIDKIILYTFLSREVVHNIHQSYTGHHDNKLKKSRNDYIQMVIDWECARFTKPDKPLNARDTLYKYYPELIKDIEPILIDLGL